MVNHPDIDHTRLGSRRNLRDYSVHQRCAGATCADRMEERKLWKLGSILLAVAVVVGNGLDLDVLLDFENFPSFVFVAALACIGAASNIRVPRLVQPPPINRTDISLDAFEGRNVEFYQLFGFLLADARRLFIALQIPEAFTLNEGRHRHHVSGEHAFLYTLFRYRSPSQRQALDTQTFGYDYSVLSKMFNACIAYIDDTHAHRLRRLPETAPRFAHFNTCITGSIGRKFPGIPLPPDAIQCSLFVDGTRFRVQRPSGDWWRQYAYFSGDKWYHCHGAQGIFGPDGMFYDWFDGPTGRQNDKYFWRDSNANTILANSQFGNALQYWCYGDKGYGLHYSHLRAAAHGPGHVTDQQKFDNWVMAKERVGVEWGYGKIDARCPFLKCAHLMKLQACDVASFVRVAVLLTNAHTCLQQSQTGLYFECEAPTLENYFA